MSKKILVIGTQGRQVFSGPGVFMQYLVDGIANGELNADILYPHSRRGTLNADKPFIHFVNSADAFYNTFFGSWVIASFILYLHLRFGGRYREYKSIWFADRYFALFCVLDWKLRKTVMVMVNDDTRIMDWEASKSLPMKFCNFAKKLRSIIFLRMDIVIARGAARTITNSDYLTEKLVMYYGLNDSRVVRLYKAVDLEAFYPATEAIAVQLPYRILFVKNEWRRGGLDILIEALAKLSPMDFELTVVGVGKQSEQDIIFNLASKAGFKGTVIHRGLLGRNEVGDCYRSANVFCVPSRREALGVAFLEAQATGLPVISTFVGGIPEVLKQGETGYLVPPEDAVALAEAIQQCLENSAERKQKQIAALEHVITFSKERMFANMIDISTELYAGVN